MVKPLRLGIAGLGTVGAGVVTIVSQNSETLAARAGRPVEVVSVSARDKSKDRGVELSSYEWVNTAGDLVDADKIDVLVELIGGSDGIAYDIVKDALSKGVSVVTANKALMAHHGLELATLAQENNVSLAYEASIAGGVPIVKALREGLAANQIKSVFGILNGTCNYILSEMRMTGRDFGDVLNEAQEMGYAETDPTFDIEGIDAGHKLCLLTALAFGTKPDFDNLQMTGITNIQAIDIKAAEEFGYKIKLLGIARCDGNKVSQILEPCLVPAQGPIGMIEDVYNAVYVEGDFVETPLFTGKGAGAGPTASSVVADIVDIARGIKIPTFGIDASALRDPDWIDLDETRSHYYLRLIVTDKPGVIADVSAILRDHEVSIENISQQSQSPGRPVPVIITTHDTRHGDMKAVCTKIAGLDSNLEQPCLMRIEEI